MRYNPIRKFPSAGRKSRKRITANIIWLFFHFFYYLSIDLMFGITYLGPNFLSPALMMVIFIRKSKQVDALRTFVFAWWCFLCATHFWEPPSAVSINHFYIFPRRGPRYFLQLSEWHFQSVIKPECLNVRSFGDRTDDTRRQCFFQWYHKRFGFF